MTGLPSRYAKMGFKKGWKAYKSSSSISTKRGITTMARRRKGSSKRSSSRRNRSFGGLGEIGNMAIGIVGAVAYEKYVSGLIPISNPMLHNAVDMGIGYYAGKRGGIIGNVGKAVMYINAYSIISGLMDGLKIGQSSSAVGSTGGIVYG